MSKNGSKLVTDKNVTQHENQMVFTQTPSSTSGPVPHPRVNTFQAALLMPPASNASATICVVQHKETAANSVQLFWSSTRFYGTMHPCTLIRQAG